MIIEKIILIATVCLTLAFNNNRNDNEAILKNHQDNHLCTFVRPPFLLDGTKCTRF